VGGAATGRDGSVVTGYSRGRDDCRWAKLSRELHEQQVQQVFRDYGAYLERSAQLNAEFEGRWHVWFVALAGSVEWLARPVGQPQVPPISAWSADALVSLIKAAQ